MAKLSVLWIAGQFWHNYVISHSLHSAACYYEFYSLSKLYKIVIFEEKATTEQWWANPNHDWDLTCDLNIFGSDSTV